MTTPTRRTGGTQTPGPRLSPATRPDALESTNGSQEPAGERLEQVLPADGTWWVVHRVRERFTRCRVAAWGVFLGGPDGWNVRALTASDGPELVVDGTDEAHLWHDGESWCSCGRRCGYDVGVTDPCWCRRCGAEIESPDCTPERFPSWDAA